MIRWRLCLRVLLLSEVGGVVTCLGSDDAVGLQGAGTWTGVSLPIVWQVLGVAFPFQGFSWTAFITMGLCLFQREW